MSFLVRYYDRLVGYRRSDFVKAVFKRIAIRLNPKILERFLAFSVLHKNFNLLKKTPLCDTRNDLYQILIERIGPNSQITYIEFGVHTGISMKYFLKSFTNQRSKFYGLDSFQGFPEAWGGWPAGGYSTNGMVPSFSDSRVKLYVGWFQETIFDLKDDIKPIDSVVIINYDADIYSSTLLALCEMNSFRPYFAIFDEFTGDECRALSNFLAAYGGSVEFFGHTEWRHYPEAVLCRISPRVGSY